ncbi:MAG: hybrid sensor histidine kinase/response regulator [Bdellovibrionales bacterium]|nr:hybrid sensor histidine kinase/response regulator [Bdellovibrionales bacterium]
MKGNKQVRERIFIVDDMEINIKIALHALKDENYEVYTFKDPREAYEKMRELRPHLFLLDVEMPHMTGIDLARKIREEYIYKEAPIIFITTLDDEKTMKAAYDAGATDFLNKPFNHLELTLRVRSVLRTFMLANKVQKTNRTLEIKASDIASLNRILVHDLAGQIQKLQLYGSLIEKGQLDLEKYNASVNTMCEIIDHVREMLALEEGKHQLDLTPVSVLDAVLEAFANVEEQANKKKVNIKIRKETLEGVDIIAHKKSLKNQVITNVLTNAIKFSFPEKDIVISGASVNDHFVLEIKDFGTGIPDEILKDLFNKYLKTTTTGTDMEKGTGFGMPLVKTYMEHYHGSIEVITKYDPKPEAVSGTLMKLYFNKS